MEIQVPVSVCGFSVYCDCNTPPLGFGKGVQEGDALLLIGLLYGEFTVHKISNDQKKDLVYHWECKADGCNSSYIGETSRALGKRIKAHSKSTTSAILKHCKDFHHPLPSISDFNIIDKDPSQITWVAKEAIHIRRLDPSLNRNIGKMSIPHCFDHLLGAKPRHPSSRSPCGSSICR